MAADIIDSYFIAPAHSSAHQHYARGHAEAPRRRRAHTMPAASNRQCQENLLSATAAKRRHVGEIDALGSSYGVSQPTSHTPASPLPALIDDEGRVLRSSREWRHSAISAPRMPAPMPPAKSHASVKGDIEWQHDAGIGLVKPSLMMRNAANTIFIRRQRY